MNIVDILSESGADIASNYVENLKDKNPEKLDQMTKLFCNLTDLAIQILRVSPEFRTQFAHIHMEFLKHPEARQIVEASTEAYYRYKPNTSEGLH